MEGQCPLVHAGFLAEFTAMHSCVLTRLQLFLISRCNTDHPFWPFPTLFPHTKIWLDELKLIQGSGLGREVTPRRGTMRPFEPTLGMRGSRSNMRAAQTAAPPLRKQAITTVLCAEVRSIPRSMATQAAYTRKESDGHGADFRLLGHAEGGLSLEPFRAGEICFGVSAVFLSRLRETDKGVFLSPSLSSVLSKLRNTG
jgi:hypothetical protein